MSYISYLLAAHSEKPGVYKVKQGSIPKPALLCRDYRLLMAVEKSFGIPLISRVYRANCHDSKIFSHILADLIISLKTLCGAETDLILILDKGNNSKKNFSYMEGKINWIGALVPFLPDCGSFG